MGNISEKPASKRLVSLDAFRGFTIAGMIIVNDPGSWSYLYQPLGHASWHGITPTDYIFPFFLYIVGVSIALAYSKRLALGNPKSSMYQKILVRSLKIFLVGIFLALFPYFNFSNLRIVGVLQRISIVFLTCAILFLNTNWRTQAIIGTVILIAYWAAMTLIPVPIDDVIAQALLSGEVLRNSGPVAVDGLSQLSPELIAANLEPGTNMSAWIDRVATPGRLWEKTWDPEGLFSTVPAIVTGISGMLAGAMIVSNKSQERKVLWLFGLGFLSFILGSVWNWSFPINKNLWSSSFVLYTSGLATLTLAASLFFVDMLGFNKWTRPGIIFGANAITAYVLAGVLSRLFSIFKIKSFLFDSLISTGLDPKFSSLIFAIGFTVLCYIPVYILYKKKIFIKL